ncbi:MAG TPA: serine/threonine-protein kinase [Polyangiaceae bacterium]|nr:serine/threonine-protein kinase [Polyangiaceae bacterium]
MKRGDLISDHLRLVAPVGKGGMGTVWCAEHLNLETQVAVKFLSPKLLDRRKSRARFRREATAAARIGSPHIVKVLDHGFTPEGLPYIVMELLTGSDLAVLLTEHAQLPLKLVRILVAHACRGLSKAHAVGIVHRDIKPANVFVSDESGEPFVRLLDFGVAKDNGTASPELTGSGVVVGTPHYMSPEQAMGLAQVDHRADLWSLGVLCYRALTGEFPFEGDTLAALALNVSQGRLVPVTQRRNGLPDALNDWFSRALAFEPKQRFQSALEMSNAFFLAVEDGSEDLISPIPQQHRTASESEATATLQPTLAASRSSAMRHSSRRMTWVLASCLSAGTFGALSWWTAAVPLRRDWSSRTAEPGARASVSKLAEQSEASTSSAPGSIVQTTEAAPSRQLEHGDRPMPASLEPSVRSRELARASRKRAVAESATTKLEDGKDGEAPEQQGAQDSAAAASSSAAPSLVPATVRRRRKDRGF